MADKEGQGQGKRSLEARADAFSRLKIFFDKTQNHDLFISPKRKNAILEMSLKSSIISKLDHQMSIILIEFAGPKLQPSSRFDLLKN